MPTVECISCGAPATCWGVIPPQAPGVSYPWCQRCKKGCGVFFEPRPPLSTTTRVKVGLQRHA